MDCYSRPLHSRTTDNHLIPLASPTRPAYRPTKRARMTTQHTTTHRMMGLPTCQSTDHPRAHPPPMASHQNTSALRICHLGRTRMRKRMTPFLIMMARVYRCQPIGWRTGMQIHPRGYEPGSEMDTFILSHAVWSNGV